MITKLGKSAYSRTPTPRGSHIAYERTFHVPRTIAMEEVLRATKLPGFWPPRYSDFSVLETAYHHDIENDRIAGPLVELCQNADQRRIVLSQDDVDRAIARAQAALVTGLNKVCAALGELLARDAEITASGRDARYPDGALIFDQTMFPENWRVGMMTRFVSLPTISSPALAAE